MSEQEIIRNTVENLYDMQKLRISTGNRAGSITAKLDKIDQELDAKISDGLMQAEKAAIRRLGRLLKRFPIYTEWLRDQDGIGPQMAGVIVSSIDIERCETVSQLWAYCGLAVVDGKSQRRTKGQKSNWNSWLRAKLVKVMGDNLIRVASLQGDGTYRRGKKVLERDQVWRRFYDDYKHRKESAEWGESDLHRHNAARRYMVKMFLLELHTVWRQMEGLPVRPPYHEEYLGNVRHIRSA